MNKNDNETIKNIYSRYSCRGFDKNKPVSDDNLDTIMQAALTSPSSYNSQNWQFVVCQNTEILDRLQNIALENAKLQDITVYQRLKSVGGRIFYDAPVAVFIARPNNEVNLASVNSGIALQTIALCATSLGLNTLMCGMTRLCFSGKNVNELYSLLKFPKDFVCDLSILMGYGTAKRKERELDKSKITYIK
ncbi:MAG: nitroreductase family protein [Clostridiales bacterium]|jgi:nitroreductase|nr:nitroreductase family protein [Clostridiales bacterium]